MEERTAKVKQLHLQKTDIFMKLIDEGRIPLRPGVLRLVDEAISNGVRLAVCSTSSELAVRNLVLTLMGEERASKFRIFAGDMVKSKKPSPDVYLMAVEDMKLSKDKCVIIEDSHIGVRAAVSAGISCLVTKSSYTAMEDFTGAKMIVDELGDEITLKTLTGLLCRDEGKDGGLAVATATAPWNRVGHVETVGASWTGARFGDDNANRPYSYTPSETYEASGSRGIGVKMVSHIEKGGASWTGARFGDDNVNKPYSYTPSETYEASGSRGIGVKMESHIEKGGASWTGARFGDDSKNSPHLYTPSETYEYKSRGKGPGARWDPVAHVEGDENAAWSGARFAGDDGGYRRAAPTPSQWRE
jgi:HAD superfamily hydrolase (TIGR01509 family)